MYHPRPTIDKQSLTRLAETSRVRVNALATIGSFEKVNRSLTEGELSGAFGLRRTVVLVIKVP